MKNKVYYIGYSYGEWSDSGTGEIGYLSSQEDADRTCEYLNNVLNILNADGSRQRNHTFAQYIYNIINARTIELDLLLKNKPRRRGYYPDDPIIKSLQAISISAPQASILNKLIKADPDILNSPEKLSIICMCPWDNYELHNFFVVELKELTSV